MLRGSVFYVLFSWEEGSYALRILFWPFVKQTLIPSIFEGVLSRIHVATIGSYGCSVGSKFRLLMTACFKIGFFLRICSSWLTHYVWASCAGIQPWTSICFYNLFDFSPQATVNASVVINDPSLINRNNFMIVSLTVVCNVVFWLLEKQYN